MTTIITDGITIASDGMICSGGARVSMKDKKILVEDGVIYALAGTQCLMRPLIDWVKAGADVEKAPKAGTDNSWGLLVIDRSGARHYHYQCPYPEPIDLPWATGSGRDWALGALKAGASPAEAVRVACEIDISSGGDIQVIDIAEALGLNTQREAAE